MTDCYQYNCDDALGTHLLNDCNSTTRGGYRNVIFLECGHSITDPSDGASILAAIAAGEAHVIKNVKLGLPAPSPTQLDSYIANAPQIVASYEHGGTMMDQNVNDTNCVFYNNLYDGRSFGGIILHNADEGQVYWYDKETRFTGGLVHPDSKSEVERFESAFTFSSKTGSSVCRIYTEPAGVF